MIVFSSTALIISAYLLMGAYGFLRRVPSMRKHLKENRPEAQMAPEGVINCCFAIAFVMSTLFWLPHLILNYLFRNP
jgi:hypothetical protein